MAIDKSKMTDTELEQEVLDAAEADETTGADQVTIKLRRPFEWEGIVYTELKFDFYKVTGSEIEGISKHMLRRGQGSYFRGFSNDSFIIEFATLACDANIGTDMIRALPSCDYMRIRTAASNFLLLWETL